MHARMNYERTDPETLLSKMKMSPDGVAWNTLFEASYERL